MLWNTQTLDPDVMQLVDGDGDSKRVLGIVHYQRSSGRYMASTQHKYLGTYPTLKFAQKAVEVQHGVELKGSGKIIVVGGNT
jgi:hypothetical protein